MTRRGPLNGSGPRSGRKLRVAAERSHNRSDNRHASLKALLSKSSSNPTEPKNILTSPAPTIVLRARGRSRFDFLFGDMQIVTSSARPICDAARVLHRLGHPDDCRLTVWHEGADHPAISGLLGFWRKTRIREDRGMPRYVAWEDLPRRVGAKKGDRKFEVASHGAGTESASTATPGATGRHPLARSASPGRSRPSDPNGGRTT
jgi:hypothetical protein